MILSTLSLLLLLSGCASGSAYNSSAPAPVPGAAAAAVSPLRLVAPAKYCAMDRGKPLDALSLDLIDKTLGDLAQLHAVWRDCDALAASRRGISDFSAPSVVISTLLQEGRVISLTMSREVFLEQMALAVSLFGKDPALNQATEDDARRRFDATIGKLADSIGLTMTMGRVRNLDLNARDENAVYLAVVGDLKVGDQSVALATISGVTLIRKSIVEVSVFQDVADGTTLDHLLAEAKDIMRGLVADNGELPGDAI